MSGYYAPDRDTSRAAALRTTTATQTMSARRGLPRSLVTFGFIFIGTGNGIRFRSFESLDMSSTHEHQRSHQSGHQPVVLSKTRARQGVTGHNVRYVLGFSLAGVIVAFGLIYLFFFAAS